MSLETHSSLDTSFIDYIPSNPNLEIQEVLRVCKADVKDMAMSEDAFLDTASNNLKSTITALIQPLIADDDYEIVV